MSLWNSSRKKINTPHLQYDQTITIYSCLRERFCKKLEKLRIYMLASLFRISMLKAKCGMIFINCPEKKVRVCFCIP